MFRNILFYNFIVSCCLGITIYLLQFYNVQLPLVINNYLNDFLIIPIVLSISLYILRFTKNDKYYKIPLLIILFLCIGYSYFFEKIMPKISNRYTADFFDVLVYFLGGFWFLFLQKQEHNNVIEC